MSRYIPKSSWGRKKAAKHFTIAKKAKAERAEKAWRTKSKSK